MKKGSKNLTTESVVILTSVLQVLTDVRLINNVSILMEALAVRNDCSKKRDLSGISS